MVWVFVLLVDVEIVVIGGGLIVFGDCLESGIRVVLYVGVEVLLFMWLFCLDERIELFFVGFFVVVFGVVFVGVFIIEKEIVLYG